MMVRLPFRRPADLPAAVAAAAETVSRHGVIALPTETFYGFAVSPTDAEAVARVFAVKQRAAEKALSVVAATMEQVEQLVCVTDPLRSRLAEAWPAPLTAVLPLRQPLACATETLAVRVPSHSLLRSLLARLGPLTATSANRSGTASLSLAEAVGEQFADVVELLLDGGPTAGGQASTLLDCRVMPPIVLRAGAFRIPDDWGVKSA